MRKRIWYSAIGLLVVGILLAGLLGVIDALAGVRPSTVSKPSIPSIGKGNSIWGSNVGTNGLLELFDTRSAGDHLLLEGLGNSFNISCIDRLVGVGEKVHDHFALVQYI